MPSLNIDRRRFLGAMGVLGAASLAGGAGSALTPDLAVAADAEFPVPKKGKPIEASVDPKTGDVKINDDVIVRYSSCVGCYSTCGNRIKLDRASGRVIGVGGNPYNPACSGDKLDFEAPLEDAYRSMSYANGHGAITHGTICGRGNGTLDGVSQPDRITVPLKRAGKRGEGKWKPISWDQLITEVTEGGKIFAELGEDQHVEGFKEVPTRSPRSTPSSPTWAPSPTRSRS
mgnify:CR=1 FL=1